MRWRKRARRSSNLPRPDQQCRRRRADRRARRRAPSSASRAADSASGSAARQLRLRPRSEPDRARPTFQCCGPCSAGASRRRLARFRRRDRRHAADRGRLARPPDRSSSATLQRHRVEGLRRSSGPMPNAPLTGAAPGTRSTPAAVSRAPRQPIPGRERALAQPCQERMIGQATRQRLAQRFRVAGRHEQARRRAAPSRPPHHRQRRRSAGRAPGPRPAPCRSLRRTRPRRTGPLRA